MHGSDPRTRQHGDHAFQRQRHIDDDAVALFHAERLKAVRGPRDGIEQLAISDLPLRAVFSGPDVRDFVLAPGLYLAIERVVRDVALAALEPFECRIFPVKDFSPGMEPLKLVGRGRPKGFRIVDRTFVLRCVVAHARLLSEKFGRMQFDLGMKKLLNSTFGLGG